MESGSREILEKIKKGITPESILRSAHMARQAGMHTTQFIILGLGGTELSGTHALETARVLNAINPDHIRVLTIGVKPGTDLDRQMRQGEWTRPSEVAMIAEQRQLFAHLDGVESIMPTTTAWICCWRSGASARRPAAAAGYHGPVSLSVRIQADQLHYGPAAGLLPNSG